MIIESIDMVVNRIIEDKRSIRSNDINHELDKFKSLETISLFSVLKYSVILHKFPWIL